MACKKIEKNRYFVLCLNFRQANTDLADEKHTTCTNNEYHALYLTGDPRTCSLRLYSAGRP